MRSYLDFEKPVAELEAKVDELRALAASGSDIGDEIARIEDKAQQALTDLYANLTPWQKTLVARHPQRPHFSDFINTLVTEFTPMAGDRKFAEDEALVGGFGRFRGEFAVAGHRREFRHQRVDEIGEVRALRMARHQRLLPWRQIGIEVGQRLRRLVLDPPDLIGDVAARGHKRAQFVELGIELGDGLFEVEIAAHLIRHQGNIGNNVL